MRDNSVPDIHNAVSVRNALSGRKRDEGSIRRKISIHLGFSRRRAASTSRNNAE